MLQRNYAGDARRAGTLYRDTAPPVPALYAGTQPVPGGSVCASEGTDSP